MIVLPALLAAAALSPDRVEADPVPGMLPHGIGQDEVAILAITDAAVQRCIDFFERDLAPKAGRRIVRRATTSSPGEGQIWRADAVSKDMPPVGSRFFCSGTTRSVEPLGAPDPE